MQKAEGRSENEYPCGGLAEKRSLYVPQLATAERLVGPDTWRLTPGFEAFGTPFAGELARVGENLRAPVAALLLLARGTENRIEPLSDAEAVRALLRNILFFAQDEELVRLVFQSVLDFVSRVPVRRLVFTPDARGWELIV
jgi:hypothetical protein